MRVLLMIPVLCMSLLAGCNGGLNCTEGNGNIKSEERTTEAFQAVKMEGSFEVILTRGSQPGVRVEAEENLLEQITTKVSRGELTIASNGCINTKEPMRVYVTAPVFKSLEVDGSGSISSKDMLSSDHEGLLELAVDGSGKINLEVFTKMIKSSLQGSGSINLRGETQGQLVKVDGSGKYQTYNLKAKETVVNLSGSGMAEVNSTGALTADISGSGNVHYKGQPEKVSSNSSGSGKLLQAQ